MGAETDQPTSKDNSPVNIIQAGLFGQIKNKEQ